MEPERGHDATVELVDVLLSDGAVLAADVVVTVADVPLVGIRLRLLLAGMARLSEEGVFEDWDEQIRASGRLDRDADGV
jgi:hypothetical protein